MSNRKGKTIMRIIAILLSALTLFGLGGCKTPEPAPVPEPEPIDGGVTNNTDYSAPKTIQSKDISDYRVNFMLGGEWAPGHENVFYTFEVKPDGSGTLTAAESVTGVSAPADKALLDALQTVIDEYALAGQNGVYRLTAGIDPSEFGPSTLTVHYASGETLTFTVDNNPDEPWVRATYLAFAKWFASQGIDTLLPSGLEKMVTDIRLQVRDGDKSWSYGFETEPNDKGERVFTRVLDGKKESVPVRDTQRFFDNLSTAIEDFDLSKYDPASPLYGYERTAEDEREPSGAAVQLTIRYEDGHEVSVRSSAESVLDDLGFLIDVLFDCFDGQFSKN